MGVILLMDIFFILHFKWVLGLILAIHVESSGGQTLLWNLVRQKTLNPLFNYASYTKMLIGVHHSKATVWPEVHYFEGIFSLGLFDPITR